MAGVELLNLRDEDMLVDVAKESSEEEEGEILDDDNDPFWTSPKQPDTRDTHVVPRSYKNDQFSVFSIDREFLEQNNEHKLQERAKRFNLATEDTKKRPPAITLKQLERLYATMGVSPSDPHVRLNALHMRGTQHMNTQQVFDYFKQYGPAAIEWVNDFCCNVVWVDDIAAARALLALSVPIKGGVKPPTRTYDIDEDLVLTLNAGPDGLTSPPRNRDDEMQVESDDESSSAVDVARVRIPVPPGTWRFGVPAPAGGHEADAESDILLRFATKSDKKVARAERSSEFYRQFGNPNYGGMPGLISNSRKRKLRSVGGGGSLEAMMMGGAAAGAHLLLPASLAQQVVRFEDVGDEYLLKMDARLRLGPAPGSNPWVNLAKTWSNFERNKHKIVPSSPVRVTPPPPSPRTTDSEDDDPISPHKRLGLVGMRGKGLVTTGGGIVKAISIKGSSSEEEQDSNEEYSGGGVRRRKKGGKVARMRMRADDEERKIEKKKEHKLRSRLNQKLGALMNERVGRQLAKKSPSPPPPQPDSTFDDDIAITIANTGPAEPTGGEEDEALEEEDGEIAEEPNEDDTIGEEEMREQEESEAEESEKDDEGKMIKSLWKKK
uniref:Nuclear cap-binding protein subunit 3 n=1 Tax=Cacopsylla melanoneura TaxID=428564 RepID=A0A8D9AHY9_9HEMI